MNTDCIIVGAGPAGSSLAIRLAYSGVNVVLIDRKNFPRLKPCGDCLSPQANLLLQQIGVLTNMDALHPALLAGWRIIAPNGASFSARFDAITNDPRLTHAYAIERSRFDALLLDAAAKAGARIETGVHVVRLILDGETVCGVQIRSANGATRSLHARIVVGADGLRSTVRARLGVRTRAPRLRKFSLTWHVENVRELSEFGEMHLREGGCIGVAPVDRSGAANLTVVADTARYAEQLRGDPASFAEHFITHAPALVGRIDPKQLHRSPPLASGPFDQPVTAVTRPGAALIGDAAGYFDPFTGQGIYHALESARLLTNAIRHDGVSAAALARYSTEYRKFTRGSRLLQRLVDAALAKPANANRWISLLDRAPDAAAGLIAVTGDIHPPRALLSPRILVSLLATLQGGPPDHRR